MGRRRGEEEHAGNHERWLLTYADLITLLMIFFILMYTMANVDKKKFADLSSALSAAFIGQQPSNQIISHESPGPSIMPGKSGEKKKMDDVQKKLGDLIKQKGLQDKIKLSQEERGLVISLKETLLFDLGSAQIKPHARDVIVKIGRILITLPNAVRTEGHTDNLPISTREFPSNWELSTARATNVVKVLVNDVNYRPNLLSATGYGEFRPLVPNTTNYNRQQNRRVDIIVVRSTFNKSEPKSMNKNLNQDALINDEGSEVITSN